MPNQTTLARSCVLKGIGVHTGRPVQVTLQPAEQDSGIVFERTDLSPCVRISATIASVAETHFCTSLIKDSVKVSTIEHIMSALSGLAVDNVRVQITAEEAPILDGSAKLICDALLEAGLVEQSALRRYLRMKETVQVYQDDQYAKLQPLNGFQVQVTLDHEHPLIKAHSSWRFDAAKDNYMQAVSDARTYGFHKDYARLLAANLALGASLDNTLVLSDSGVMDIESYPLRHQDECVRHKVLDAIGDLYLLGFPVIGCFEGYKSGHSLNAQLVQAVVTNPDSYEVVTTKEWVGC